MSTTQISLTGTVDASTGRVVIHSDDDHDARANEAAGVYEIEKLQQDEAAGDDMRRKLDAALPTGWEVTDWDYRHDPTEIPITVTLMSHITDIRGAR